MGLDLGTLAEFSTQEVSATGGLEILVADDSVVERAKMTILLRRAGYDVIEAKDGEKAWELLQERPVRLVFTDWMMPRMNGIELIQRIRTTDLGRYIYVILCSGKDSKSDVIEGIQAGADDFLSKPTDPGELRARIHAGERVIDLQRRLEKEKKDLLAAHDSLSKTHEIMRSDLQAAAKLQKSLLPAPGSYIGVQFDWAFWPCSQVAGDIFNVFPLDKENVAFYQLDVSGHGISSAMLSFSLSKMLNPSPLRDSLLKQHIPTPPYDQIVSPEIVARELNRSFQNEDDLYFTLVYGIVNVTTRRLRMTQAGHPHPILLREGSAPRLLGDGGFPVGALPNMEFELVEEELQPGDRLFVYSDGVTECINGKQEQFGAKRVQECLKRTASLNLHDAIRDMEKTLLDWHESTEFSDDISMLGIELGFGQERG